MKDFIKKAIENGDVKKYSEVYDTDPNILEECDRLFYIGEKTVKYPRYEIGDIIYVKDHKDNKYVNNHLFVIVDDDNGVVKKVVYGEDFIELISINPMYPPRIFKGEEMKRIRVFGKVIGLKRKF